MTDRPSTDVMLPPRASRDKSFLVGATLLILGIGLIVLVVVLSKLLEPARAFLDVLLFVAGAVVWSGLTLVQQSVALRLTAKPEDEESPELLRLRLGDPQRLVQELAPSTQESAAAIELRDLLLLDPTLALAKLRIDLEADLRQLAASSGIQMDGRVMAPGQLIRELSARNVLVGDLQSSLSDVLSVCNRAIHGLSVSLENARSVIDVGGALHRKLRALSGDAKSAASPR